MPIEIIHFVIVVLLIVLLFFAWEIVGLKCNLERSIRESVAKDFDRKLDYFRIDLKEDRWKQLQENNRTMSFELHTFDLRPERRNPWASSSGTIYYDPKNITFTATGSGVPVDDNK